MEYFSQSWIKQLIFYGLEFGWQQNCLLYDKKNKSFKLVS